MKGSQQASRAHDAQQSTCGTSSPACPLVHVSVDHVASATTLTHLESLSKVAITLEHVNHLLTTGQRHPSAGLEYDVEDRPQCLEDLAIDYAAAARIQVGPASKALEDVAVYVPDTDTAHDLCELGPGDVWASVESLAKMNAVSAPYVVEQLNAV